MNLRGSITPVITPFAGGEIDFDAFERLVERQLDGGSSGIVVTGTTGEPTSLTRAERLELYRRAVSVVGGRVEVVAATGSSNHAETLELTAAAATLDVDAVMVVAPPFIKPSQPGLVEHYTKVAERVEKPMIIYNIPNRSGVAVEADTVVAIAERCPNLVGVKHASSDLDYITELLQRLGDEFRIYCGLESYSYPMLMLGCAGLMSAVGNLFPEDVAQLCTAVSAGDHPRALELHRHLFAVNRAVFIETNPVPLKAMLAEHLGISAEVRPPLSQASEATQERLTDVLGRYDAASSGARPRSSRQRDG